MYGNTASGGKAIIFVNTKARADEVNQAVNEFAPCDALHGDIAQASREKASGGSVGCAGAVRLLLLVLLLGRPASGAARRHAGRGLPRLAFKPFKPTRTSHMRERPSCTPADQAGSLRAASSTPQHPTPYNLPTLVCVPPSHTPTPQPSNPGLCSPTTTHPAQALGLFREGKYSALVATDVAARGLDIPSVDLVVHYDVPQAGRAGGGGRS